MTALERDTPTPIRWEKMLPWLLLLAGFLLYLPSLSAPFVYDDGLHIERNPTIRHLDRLGKILASDRRMVVTLSLAVNYALDGDQPRGYHLFNVVVHLLAASVLYALIRQTLLGDRLRERYGQHAHWLAFAVTLLWMVHPLCTQAVAYVIQRGEALMGLFYLLTIYCVMRAGRRDKPIGWYVAAVVAMLLGLMSKEVMVTAPLMVLLYDRAFVAGNFKLALRRRWPLYLVLMATWFYLTATKIDTIVAPTTAAGGGGTVGFSTQGVTPLTYLATQSAVIVHYLRLTLWPDALVFLYEWHPATHITQHWPQSIFLIGLFATTCWALWRRPMWGFLGAWLFVILAPTSSFVPLKHPIFEYRMYLPLAGVVALLVFAAHHWLKDKPKPALAMVLVAAVLLAGRTTVRLRDYQSEMQLWQSVVDANYENPVGLSHLAMTYRELGAALLQDRRFEEAQRAYDIALKYSFDALAIDPTSFEAAHNVGVIYMETGRGEDAEKWFLVLTKDAPYDSSILYNLGRIAFDRGDMKQAERWFFKTIMVKREHASGHDMLGVVKAKRGALEEAAREHEFAIQINPANAISYHNLGRVRIRQGRPEEALKLFQTANALAPANPIVLASIGDALAMLGQPEKAVDAYRTAMRSSGESLSIAVRFAWLLSTHPNDDVRDGNIAVGLMEYARDAARAQVPRVLDALAAAYAEVGRFDDAVKTQQRAIAILDPDRLKDQQVKPAYEKRLKQYQAGQPHRESPVTAEIR